MKRTALKRRTPLRRKPWRKALGTPEQRLAFKQAVCASGQCIMAGHSAVSCRGPNQAAHVIRKATLRRLGFGAEVVYNERIAVCACEGHHVRHDNGVERFPLALLPEQVLEYVNGLGLSYVLLRAA